MIGKFTGTDVPACGFSIGFERIIAILTDQKFKIPNQRSKKAFLYDKRIGAGELAELLREAKAERDRGFDVLVVRMAKNKKFQREQLTEQGYTEFKDFYTQK